MEFADLHTLLVVSEQQSFSRAATLLHRTQPAVSLAIRRLEQRVGATLFSRETKRPELTEAGRVLVAYAQRVSTLQEEARTALAHLRGIRNATVTVGVSVTAIALPSKDVITGDGQVIAGPVDVGTRPDTSGERGPVTLSLSYDCTTK